MHVVWKGPDDMRAERYAMFAEERAFVLGRMTV